jgi:hypothetical protein
MCKNFNLFCSNLITRCVPLLTTVNVLYFYVKMFCCVFSCFCNYGSYFVFWRFNGLKIGQELSSIAELAFSSLKPRYFCSRDCSPLKNAINQFYWFVIFSVENWVNSGAEQLFYCGRFYYFFLRGSAIPFPVGFCYRQVAILLWLQGITVIISPHLISAWAFSLSP